MSKLIIFLLVFLSVSAGVIALNGCFFWFIAYAANLIFNTPVQPYWPNCIIGGLALSLLGAYFKSNNGGKS